MASDTRHKYYYIIDRFSLFVFPLMINYEIFLTNQILTKKKSNVINLIINISKAKLKSTINSLIYIVWKVHVILKQRNFPRK